MKTDMSQLFNLWFYEGPALLYAYEVENTDFKPWRHIKGVEKCGTGYC
jgi:hypothetical protein